MSLEVDVRKLELFNKVSKKGSRKVAASLGQLFGMDAETRVARINLLHMDDVKTHVGDDEVVGIHVELKDPPTATSSSCWTRPTASGWHSRCFPAIPERATVSSSTWSARPSRRSATS